MNLVGKNGLGGGKGGGVGKVRTNRRLEELFTCEEKALAIEMERKGWEWESAWEERAIEFDNSLGVREEEKIIQRWFQVFKSGHFGECGNYLQKGTRKSGLWLFCSCHSLPEGRGWVLPFLLPPFNF